jgi:hypothetical protein
LVSRGEIYKDAQFTYPAGNITDKFIIVLNKIPSTHHPIIVIPVTTVDRRHKYREGCNHHQCVFFMKAKQDFFENDTLIQIYVMTDIPPDKFQEKLQRRVLEKVTHLNKNTVVHLMNCIENLKDDIQEEYHQYIF